MDSLKETCIKQHHNELHQKQIKLLEWDLPSRLAPLIGVDDLDDEVLRIMIDVARGCYFSESFHIMGRALAEAVNKEIYSNVSPTA